MSEILTSGLINTWFQEGFSDTRAFIFSNQGQIVISENEGNHASIVEDVADMVTDGKAEKLGLIVDARGREGYLNFRKKVAEAASSGSRVSSVIGEFAKNHFADAGTITITVMGDTVKIKMGGISSSFGYEEDRMKPQRVKTVQALINLLQEAGVKYEVKDWLNETSASSRTRS